MTVNSTPEENTRPVTAEAPASRSRLRQLPQVLRNWSRARVATSIAAAVLAAVFQVAANGMIAGVGTGWTGYALVGAGSILAGFLAGSYVNAPIGDAVRSALARPGPLRHGVGELGEGSASVSPDRRRTAVPVRDGMGLARSTGAGAQGHARPQRIRRFGRRRLHRLPPAFPHKAAAAGLS